MNEAEDVGYYHSLALSLDRADLSLPGKAPEMIETMLRHFPERLSEKQKTWLLDLRDRYLHGKGVVL